MGSIKLLSKVVFALFLFSLLMIPKLTKAADWTRIISNGEIAGTTDNYGILDIEYFNGSTYIMTVYGEDYHPRIFKFDGTNWTNITSDSFGGVITFGELGATNIMTIYDGLPCFGGSEDLFDSATVYCYSGSGNIWSQINQNGFGADDFYVRKLVTFNGSLYASSIAIEGARVWKYDGSGTGWTQINVDNFGQEIGEVGLELFLSYIVEYNGSLYTSTYSDSGPGLWKYSGSGTEWSAIDMTGIGNNPHSLIINMSAFKGNLYAITVDLFELADDTSEIWRYNGTNWERELTCGESHACSGFLWDMTNYKDRYLYASTVNLSDNASKVMQSEDGQNWSDTEVINFGVDHSSVMSLGIMGENSYLLAGTFSENGAELWMKEIPPLVTPSVATLPATGSEATNQKPFYIIIVLVFSSILIIVGSYQKKFSSRER